MVGFDAGLPGLADRRRAVAEEATGAGGEGIDPSKEYGANWWNHRNDAVDLYRRIMGPDRIFWSGAVVDTMEVAGLWSGLPRLYAGVRAALAEGDPEPGRAAATRRSEVRLR